MIFSIGPAGALWSLAASALTGGMAAGWLRTRLALAFRWAAARVLSNSSQRFLFASSPDLFSPAPVGVWGKLIPAEPEQPAPRSHLKAAEATVTGAQTGHFVRIRIIVILERSHHPSEYATRRQGPDTRAIGCMDQQRSAAFASVAPCSAGAS